MPSEFLVKYEVKDKIGEGTFSEVLKCRNISTGEVFAVKKLKKHYSRLSEAVDLPELLILTRLPPHSNVLTLLEHMYDPQEGKLFMVFEIMEMSLYDLIQSRKRCLPETRVKHMFYQVLKGVDHLHSHGIFHRDIKPENILVSKAVVKLSDLGSVRGIQSQQPFTEYISTRWYRAPECILTQGLYGPKMDVWACGCVYFELLTSKPIFPGANEVDQLTKIHRVVGTPNPRVMLKLRRTKSRVGDIKFATYPSLNFAVLLPFTSDGGREILKRMLMYDPEVRANVSRLLEHRYFNDLRDTSYISKYSNIIEKQWSCPAIHTSVSPTPKPKLKAGCLVTNAKKATKTKLTTNTWAPSTNTSKVTLTHSKSKVDNKIPPNNNVKKRPGQLSVRTNNIINLTDRPSLEKSRIKQQRTTEKSKGDLPSLNTMLKITSNKGYPTDFVFKPRKSFLPPIYEQ